MSLGLHIAQRIWELRKHQGLSQEQLATKADMEATVLSRIERGQNTNIKINTLEKIITALGVSHKTFFAFTDDDDLLSRLDAKLSLLDSKENALQIFEDILDFKMK